MLFKQNFKMCTHLDSYSLVPISISVSQLIIFFTAATAPWHYVTSGSFTSHTISSYLTSVHLEVTQFT